MEARLSRYADPQMMGQLNCAQNTCSAPPTAYAERGVMTDFGSGTPMFEPRSEGRLISIGVSDLPNRIVLQEAVAMDLLKRLAQVLL